MLFVWGIGENGVRKELAVKQTGKKRRQKKEFWRKFKWGWFSGKAKRLALKTEGSVLYLQELMKQSPILRGSGTDY